MDWVERLFGLSPDGGNGSFEAMISIAVALVLALAAAGVLSRRRARR